MVNYDNVTLLNY